MKASFMHFEFICDQNDQSCYKAFLGKLVDQTRSIPEGFRDRLNLFLILIDELYPEAVVINITVEENYELEINFSFKNIMNDPDQDIVERLGIEFDLDTKNQIITGKMVMKSFEEIFN